jgi:hypothetical protein
MTDIYKFVIQSEKHYIVTTNNGITKTIDGTYYGNIDGTHHIVERNKKLYIIAYQKNEIIYEFSEINVDRIWLFNTIPTFNTILRHDRFKYNIPSFINYSYNNRVTGIIIINNNVNYLERKPSTTYSYDVTDLKNITVTERNVIDEDKYIYLTKNIYLKNTNDNRFLLKCKYINEELQNSLTYKQKEYLISRGVTSHNTDIFCYRNIILVNRLKHVVMIHFDVNPNGTLTVTQKRSKYRCDCMNMLTMNERYAYYIMRPKSENKIGIINLKTLEHTIVEMPYKLQDRMFINCGDSIVISQKRILSKNKTCFRMAKYNRKLKELGDESNDIICPINKQILKFITQSSVDTKEYINGMKPITNKLIIHTDLWYTIFKYL